MADACDQLRRDVVPRLDGQSGQLKTLLSLVKDVAQQLGSFRAEAGSWASAENRAMHEILADLQSLEDSQTVGEAKDLLFELWDAYRSPVIAGMLGLASLHGRTPVMWRLMYLLLSLVADPVTGMWIAITWFFQLVWGLRMCTLTWGPCWGLPPCLRPVPGAPGLATALLYGDNELQDRMEEHFRAMRFRMDILERRTRRRTQLNVGEDDTTIEEVLDETSRGASTAGSTRATPETVRATEGASGRRSERERVERKMQAGFESTPVTRQSV